MKEYRIYRIFEEVFSTVKDKETLTNVLAAVEDTIDEKRKLKSTYTAMANSSRYGHLHDYPYEKAKISVDIKDLKGLKEILKTYLQ